jgi:hypothetical protein
LVLNPAAELRKIPQTSWYRLQRLVEATSSVCLVITRHSLVNSAQLKLVLENWWSLEHLTEHTSISRWRFGIRRSHFKPEISHLRFSAATNQASHLSEVG